MKDCWEEINRQLSPQAEPLRALYERTSSQYSGNYHFYYYYLFNKNHVSINTLYKILSYVSDLESDSKPLNINEEVINLDPSKIKVEETGECIVRKIQDWLLKEASSKDIAGLPEDTTQ